MAKRRICRPKSLAPIGREISLPMVRKVFVPCNEKGPDPVVTQWRGRCVEGRMDPTLGMRPSPQFTRGDAAYNAALIRKYKEKS